MVWVRNGLNLKNQKSIIPIILPTRPPKNVPTPGKMSVPIPAKAKAVTVLVATTDEFAAKSTPNGIQNSSFQLTISPRFFRRQQSYNRLPAL
jgi:hypothetical protein